MFFVEVVNIETGDCRIFSWSALTLNSKMRYTTSTSNATIIINRIILVCLVAIIHFLWKSGRANVPLRRCGFLIKRETKHWHAPDKTLTGTGQKMDNTQNDGNAFGNLIIKHAVLWYSFVSFDSECLNPEPLTCLRLRWCPC